MRPSLRPVSFIVPVHNDAARLERCLRSIASNASPTFVIEVLVIDNGSTDGSAAVAKRHGARVLVIHDGKVARLRNIGAREASGDILAFIDADNEISSQWVRAAIETLASSTIGAVGAHYHAPPDGTWVQHAYGLLRGRPNGVHDVEWLGSGNLAVRRSLFDEVGGFDASLEACEDVDLCHRIRATGHRVVSDARLTSIHYGDPATLRELFRGERWRGRDNLRVSFRSPLAWHLLPSAIIPVFDTMMLAAVVIGTIGMVAGLPGALMVTAVGLLGISGGSLMKVARAARREPLLKGRRLSEAFVVALVYDIARALAVVCHARHPVARPALTREL
jgi:GT2 family glycosyltransferase